MYYATLQAETSLNLDDFAPLCDEVDQPDWEWGVQIGDIEIPGWLPRIKDIMTRKVSCSCGVRM